MKRISSRRALKYQTPSTSKVWPIDHREDYRSYALPFFNTVQIFPNKAVGTIWRDLSKPPQRRQGPDPRPSWLLVGTPFVLGPELAFRQAEHSHSGVCLYIFLKYCFYHLTCLCNNFYGLSALVGCWSSAFIRRIIYKFLNVCPFDYTPMRARGGG